MANLDPAALQAVFLRFAPDVDPIAEGIFATPWVSTETFHRMTSEYVVPEKRLAYKLELERVFPGKKGVF